MALKMELRAKTLGHAARTCSSHGLACRVRNTGTATQRARGVTFEVGALADSGPARVFVHGGTMCSTTGLYPAAGGRRSYGCIGIAPTGGGPAVLMGAMDLRCTDVWFELVEQPGRFVVQADVLLDHVPLSPGETRDLPDMVRMEGDSLFRLLEEYGQLSGQAMGARLRRQPVYGWCSWYCYYGHETEDDVLANARELRRRQILPPGAVIQIDDGWNLPAPGQPRNWGDWHSGGKFPHGMGGVVKSLHALGYQAGLCLAPFSVDADSRLAARHPEWLLGEVDQGLLEEGVRPVRGLDLTHPGVTGFLDETFERVFNTWGFDYVKLDFLLHAMSSGTRHDPSVTRAAAMHRALMRIRKIAGERTILCCGSPFGPAVGAADAMRVGFDTGSRWHAPMKSDVWAHGNCSIKPAAYPVIHRHWMNGRWWMNDPDCLVVRDAPNVYEPLHFDERHPGGVVPPDDFGLRGEEAGFWARLVYVTRSYSLLSEVFGDLSPERQGLVRAAFRTHPSSFQVEEDLGPEQWLLRSADGKAVALFNFDDACARGIRFAGCLPGAYREVFSGEEMRMDESGEFPSLPPRAARIWTWRGS